jgi:hypothetical protein
MNNEAHMQGIIHNVPKGMILVRDVPVGGVFADSNPGTLTKTQEVGATGDGWCYCRSDRDGKLHRVQWDNVVTLRLARIGGES